MTGYTFNQLFDFTRTTAGTFVGSNGLLQTTPASVNLLTFTQEFDNAGWTKLDATVTANNAIAPDGTSTADKLVEGTGAGQHALLRTETVSSAPVTYSVYAKAAERSWVSLYIGAANTSAFFNLATGVVGTVQASVTASITSVGNGWYRCSITAASVGSGALTRGIYVANADNSNSYTGNGTSGIFLWGAQLELGSTATTYARNNGGVFPPRFDYDPVTRAPRGILIEEQRTNFVLQSNAFTTSPWGLDANVDLIANSTASPDGAINAWKMAAKNGLVSIGSSQFFSKAASAITYNTSIFSKAAGYDWLQIAVFDGTNGNRYWFNVNTGAIGTTAVIGTGFTGVSASIAPASNGFFRCSLIATSSTATSYSIYIYPSATNGSNGTGNANGDGVFVYGAQIEAGAFATSYIPTVASQVTRSADVCSIVAPMFAPWYRQSEGTFVVDSAPYSVGNFTSASATDGSTNNRVQVTSSNTIQFLVGTGGVVQAILDAGTVNGGVPNKVAGAYSLNDFAATINGSAAATDTSGTVPTVARLDVGNLSGFSEFLNGHIRRITYYPFRASNNQLQALTT